MSTITLPNIRVSSDLTVKVRLKDGGVAIDWSTLSGIRALIYADAQRAMAGRCAVSIDAEDATLLVCQYAANKPQYLGVNRIVVSATYQGETKTYDKPALKFVRWTDDQAGQEITISDPDVDVEIEVEDISSSILQEAVDAAFSAAVRADEAAAAAEHMVDIHQGPPGPAGKAPYVDATTGNWFVWDDQTEQYVDSGNPAQGPAGNGIASWSVVESQEDGGSNVVTVVFTNGESESFTVKNGNTGATPNFVMGIVTTGAPGSQAGAQITGTPANPILHLTIPQGEPGVAAVRYVQVDTLPSASSHTLDALYLVPTNTADVYDVYYTTRDGQTYSWVKLCTTSVQLSDYATKAEVTQLEAKKADKDMVRAYMMSDRAKNALLAVLDKVAFAVPDVSDEMDELTEALFNLDEVVGVEATYTQGATVIWSDGVSSLDDLLPNLVVKAVYGDGTKVVVQNFILSGTLTAGTSTITVTYLGEFIDTFDVTVTEYGSKMSYTMAEGSILNKPGRLSAYTYGGNENTQGVQNYELSTETTRRVFVTNFGKQKVRDSATDNVIDCYPIKIPKDAVSVTVTVSGSNQQIACRVWYLLENGHFTDRNFNGSEIYPYKSVNYATGSNTLDISAITGRDDTFLFVWGQRVSGASYSGNEPTAITVTFSNS